MKFKKPFITVFTATHNRSRLLSRVYESIKKQTFTNFEWIIVDDGSTDNTELLVETWIKEGEIDIKYYYQENSGKHVAINKGVREAKGELFFIADDDDWLSDNALENINKFWQTLQEEIRNKIADICGLCAYKGGKIVETKFPSDLMISDSIEIRTFYEIKGDKSEVFRTEILKEFPFPSSVGKFVPEGLIWNRIAKKYKMIFVNDIWIYKEYQPYGLSAKTVELRVKNLDVTLLYYKEFIEIKNKRIKLKYKFRNLINYCRFSFHKKKLFKNLRNIDIDFGNKLLSVISVPIGFLLYFKDKLKLRGMKL